MNNITVNMDNLSKDERARLVELIRKANKEPEPEYWMPKKGEIYYTICDTEGINGYKYINDRYDKEKMRGFNFFKTKEEAEFHAKKIQIINHMAKIASIDPVDNADDSTEKWYICYSSIHKDVNVTQTVIAWAPPTIFKTKELAQKAIEEIGEENLKKYYFGVGD